MSWAVSVGNVETDHTYNTSKMIKEVCGSTPSDWAGKIARDLLPILANGIISLRSNSEEYRKYEPDNKWGTVETTINFLEEIEQGCRDNPNDIVSVF